MPISQTAQQNHEQLFPGHTSTLGQTDPELVDIFDNFAFDEALGHGDLDARTWLMTGRARPRRPEADRRGGPRGRALRHRSGRRTAHSALPARFIGYPRTLNALRAVDDVDDVDAVAPSRAQ